MTMELHSGDIDRLIEEGLGRYGKGDLDGALAAWEQALSVDPEKPASFQPGAFSRSAGQIEY